MRRRTKGAFGLRTLGIPLIFMLVHLVVATVVQTAVLLVVAFREGGLAVGGDIMQDMLDITGRYFGIMATIYSVIQILIYIAWLRSRQRREYPIYYFQRKGMPSHWVAAILIMIGVMGFAQVFFNWLEALGGFNPRFGDVIENYSERMGVLVAEDAILFQILYLVILIPTAEELLFRGIIMSELKRAMPAWLAIVLNGVLFGIFHMDPVQGIYAGLAGMALAAIYMWSESLVMAIVMHAFFNFSGSVLPTLLEDYEAVQALIVMGEIVFVFVGIFAAVWFYLHRRYQGTDFFRTRELTKRIERWRTRA